MKKLIFILLLSCLSLHLGAQINWSFENQTFATGADVEVKVRVNGFKDIGAFQYALRYDSAVLAIRHDAPFTFTGVLPYSADCISHGLMPGLVQPTNLLPNEIRTAWADPFLHDAPDGSHVYSIHFTARRAGSICESLSFYSTGLLTPEAWHENLTTAVPQSVTCTGQARRIEKAIASNRADEPTRANIYLGGRLTIYPNPVTDTSTIAVDLQQPQPIQINVLDSSGYTVFGSHHQHPGNGAWEYPIDFPAAPGIYFVVVEGVSERFMEKVSKL